MCALRDNGSSEFKASLAQLEKDLNSPNEQAKLEAQPPKHQTRLLTNPNQEK